jgi:hypothetical protein
MIKFLISRTIAFGFVFCLTACSAIPQHYTSQVIEPPTEKIHSLIIWNMQEIDQDDGIPRGYIPEFVDFMESNLNERNIVIKRITTAKLSLSNPKDEVDEFIQKTRIANVLKVYVTNASTRVYLNSPGSNTQRIFTINVELINSINSSRLWKASTDVRVGGGIFSTDNSIESVAAGLVNKMRDDNALNPSFRGVDASR